VLFRSQLDFLTEIPEVLQGNPYLSTVIAVDSSRKFSIAYQIGLIRNIHAAKYDLVVDFLANPRSAYYSFFSAAKTRLSYGYGHRRWAYNLVPTKDNEPIYAAEDKLRLLKSIGVSDDGPDLNFYPSESNREEARKLLAGITNPIITISPVSRRVYRQWPLENYATLADRLVTKFNASILILTGPDEEEAAQKIILLAKTMIHDIRVSSLGLLGAIFERSSLHIGNDNGPKHIAVACGAPTLAIFGLDSPISWTYPDPLKHDWIAPQTNSICSDGKNQRIDSDSINTITVDDVWKKVLKMTGSLPSFDALIKKA
jgi:heptosyltransferase III